MGCSSSIRHPEKRGRVRVRNSARHTDHRGGYPPVCLSSLSRRLRKRFFVTSELLSWLDVRVLHEALLVLGDEGQDEFKHPPVIHFVGEEGIALGGVATQVKDHRKLRSDDRLFDALAVPKPYFDVVPLDRHQRPIWPEEQQGLTASGLTLAEQKLGGVDAVHWPIGGNLIRSPCEGRESLVPVVGGEDLLRNHTRRHFARPADYRWNPHRALRGRGKKVSSPGTVRTTKPG